MNWFISNSADENKLTAPTPPTPTKKRDSLHLESCGCCWRLSADNILHIRKTKTAVVDQQIHTQKGTHVVSYICTSKEVLHIVCTIITEQDNFKTLNYTCRFSNSAAFLISDD